jgi:hypothetical protein
MCRVASVLSDKGVSLEDAEYTYQSASHAGVFAVSDLKRAEWNLRSLGLAVDREDSIQVSNDMLSLLDGTLEDAHIALLARQIRPSAELSVDGLPAGLSLDQREALLLALSRRFEETRQREIGSAAERLVELAARTELEELGEFELSRRVRRVSLLSDQLGYDIVAPSMSGRSRRFEVKGTAIPIGDTFRFHISRNEADYGKQDPLWFMIACHISDLEAGQGEIIGWCSIEGIAEFLPIDATGGKWASAEITLPRTALKARIPSPYLV